MVHNAFVHSIHSLIQLQINALQTALKEQVLHQMIRQLVYNVQMETFKLEEAEFAKDVQEDIFTMQIVHTALHVLQITYVSSI